jgi:hypothetical protein
MFGTIAVSQVVIGVLWPALVSLEKLLITDVNLQNTVVAATNSVFAVLIVIFRKPSTAGGTVATAVQIAPAPPGTDLVASADPVTKK